MLLEQSFLSHYQSGNLDRAADVAVKLEQLGSQLGLSVEPALAAAVAAEDWQAVIALSENMAQTDQGYILSAGLRSWALLGLKEPETALQEQQRLADFITDSQTEIPGELMLLQKAHLAEMSGRHKKLFRWSTNRLASRTTGPAISSLAVASGLWRLGQTDTALANLATYADNDVNVERLGLMFNAGQIQSAQAPQLKSQMINLF